MAQVWLTADECDAGGLPTVCMVCGEWAERTVATRFTVRSPAVYLLFLVIGVWTFLVLALTGRRMVVACPVCDRHAGYWWKGRLLASWLIVSGFVSPFACLQVAALIVPAGGAAGWVWPAALALPAMGLIAGVAVLRGMVRPLRMTADEILLTNLSDEFVAAVAAADGGRLRDDD